MHKHKRIKTAVMLLIVGALGVFILVSCRSTGQKPEVEERRIPVRVETVKKDTLQRTVVLGGLLKPKQEVVLAAKNPLLKVTAIAVAVGDRVGPGDPLVFFDSRELDLQLEQARLNYERNKELYNAGAVSQYQMEQLAYTLDNLMIQKENMVLTSPIEGVVSSLAAAEGQLAGSVPLVSVVDNRRLELTVQVGEAHINKVGLGGILAVSIPAAAGNAFTGTVTAIAPRADARTCAYPVTIEIENRDGIVKGGMYGEVELVIDSKDNVLVIPQYAVLDLEQKKVVYVVEEGKAVEKEVQTGITLGDRAEVTAGLEEGEQLIVEGQYGVNDGVPVILTGRGEQL